MLFWGDMLFYSLFMMMGIVYYSDIGFNTVLKRGAKAGALSQGFQGASPHFAATAWVILLWSALWFAWVFFLWIFWFVSGLTLSAGILRSEAWRRKRSVVWMFKDLSDSKICVLSLGSRISGLRLPTKSQPPGCWMLQRSRLVAGLSFNLANLSMPWMRSRHWKWRPWLWSFGFEVWKIQDLLWLGEAGLSLHDFFM